MSTFLLIIAVTAVAVYFSPLGRWARGKGAEHARRLQAGRDARRRGQDGSALLELVIGVPMFMLTTMFVLSLVAWPARMNATHIAAYEAAKAVVSAPDADSGMATGSERAQETLANHGFPNALVGVDYAGGLDRGGAVQATVTVHMPAITVPLVGTLASWDFAKSSTARVPDYRGLG